MFGGKKPQQKRHCDAITYFYGEKYYEYVAVKRYNGIIISEYSEKEPAVRLRLALFRCDDEKKKPKPKKHMYPSRQAATNE